MPSINRAVVIPFPGDHLSRRLLYRRAGGFDVRHGCCEKRVIRSLGVSMKLLQRLGDGLGV